MGGEVGENARAPRLSYVLGIVGRLCCVEYFFVVLFIRSKYESFKRYHIYYLFITFSSRI